MTEPTRAIPFRAGHLIGEAAQAMHAATVLPAVDPDSVVLLADVSEFQPNVDLSYLAWSKAVIMRAAYGDAHDDGAWYGGARRAFFHGNGIRYLGIYQYIVASQNITAQAKAFCQLIGPLQDGEDLYADIEEGDGDLQSTWQTWANVVHGETGWAPKDYSGVNFAAAHGLAPVDWVAAYGSSEPSVRHMLWQFSSSYALPGIGVGDCSVFHGSITDLAALAYHPAVIAHPTAAPAAPAGFHGEYITGGMFSLAALAVKLGVPPSTLLRMTAVHYGSFGNELAAWLNAVAAGTVPALAALPKGITFWVD
jgi:GH25 family lysozyme M1 (1,4-beta-N-acetylmuramidase)